MARRVVVEQRPVVLAARPGRRARSERRAQPHDGRRRRRSSRPVRRRRARRRRRRRSPPGSATASASRERLGLERAEGGLAVGLEDLAHGAAGAGLDHLRRCRRTGGRRRGRDRSRPTVVLPRAHHADEHARGDRVIGRRSSQATATDRPSALRDQLVHRVAAELALRLVGQHQRHHRLGHHAHGRHGGDVGALLEARPSPPWSRCRRSSASGRFRVASGFMAARTTSSSPVDMPPSMPPASVRLAAVARPRRRPRRSGRGPRCPAGRRPRSRRRSRRPSPPGCS